MEWVVVVILLLLILVAFYFRDKFSTPSLPQVIEHYNDPKNTETEPPAVVASTQQAMGYPPDAPWDEKMKATELEPSLFVQQMDFVKDVRRFSSGANFTSVTDDNTNSDFVNFRGLRRPQHVPIGSSARQIPDIDETVLQRNGGHAWFF